MVPFSQVRDLIGRAIHPGHFFAGRAIGLEWEHAPAETIPWEVFHGRLVEPRHTRQRRTFEAWHVWLLDHAGRSAEPLLSVKLDEQDQHIHVVRAIHSYVWEPVAEGNVIHTQEGRQWVRELVGAIDLTQVDTGERLRDELAGRLFQAVVGTSRLALTSLEAPLPAFTVGQLAYFFQPDLPADAGPMRHYHDLLDRALVPGQPQPVRAKLLEVLLRSTRPEDLADAAGRFVSGRQDGPLPELFLAMVDDVALSPWTDFVDQSLLFLRVLAERQKLSAEDHVDVIGTLLRRLGRHLTAFDLVTFHHRGANYPDALLLDALLKEYLRLAERHPELFQDRLRRRALRQSWLLRRHYEGHHVPDVPTSEGENRRVLPLPRVPEEQIVNPLKRPRQLFLDGDRPEDLPHQATLRTLLEQSIADLSHPAELRELGTALFLDRPLGAGKRPGEPDQTPLLSYVAFSRSVAERRLRELAQLGQLRDLEAALARLEQLEVAGVTPVVRSGPSRPGVASLADAAAVAGDFVLFRTTPRAVAEFLARFDFAPLAARLDLSWLRSEPVVIVGDGINRVTIHDRSFRPRLELEVDARTGFRSTAAGETPARGLHLLRAWCPEETDLFAEDLRALPR